MPTTLTTMPQRITVNLRETGHIIPDKFTSVLLKHGAEFKIIAINQLGVNLFSMISHDFSLNFSQKCLGWSPYQ